MSNVIECSSLLLSSSVHVKYVLCALLNTYTFTTWIQNKAQVPWWTRTHSVSVLINTLSLALWLAG